MVRTLLVCITIHRNLHNGLLTVDEAELQKVVAEHACLQHPSTLIYSIKSHSHHRIKLATHSHLSAQTLFIKVSLKFDELILSWNTCRFLWHFFDESIRVFSLRSLRRAVLWVALTKVFGHISGEAVDS